MSPQIMKRCIQPLKQLPRLLPRRNWGAFNNSGQGAEETRHAFFIRYVNTHLNDFMYGERNHYRLQLNGHQTHQISGLCWGPLISSSWWCPFDRSSAGLTQESRRGESQCAATTLNALSRPSRIQNDWSENRGSYASFFLWLNEELKLERTETLSDASSQTQMLQLSEIRFKRFKANVDISKELKRWAGV